MSLRHTGPFDDGYFGLILSTQNEISTPKSVEQERKVDSKLRQENLVNSRNSLVMVEIQEVRTRDNDLVSKFNTNPQRRRKVYSRRLMSRQFSILLQNLLLKKRNLLLEMKKRRRSQNKELTRKRF